MRSQYVYKKNMRGQALTLTFNVKKNVFYKNTKYSTKLKLFHCYLIALAQGGNNSTFLLYSLWYFQVLNPRLFRQLEGNIKTNKTTDTHCKLLTLNKAWL